MSDTRNPTHAERVSDRELAVTREFDAPVEVVFAAWHKAENFRQWWAPRSAGLNLVSCAMDVRTGGAYRLEFQAPGHDQPMTFFGRYLEVVPNSRISWTNDEGGEGQVTTVTFEDRGGKTLLTVHDLFPSKEALDEELSSGATAGMPETLDQLAEFVAGR